MPKLPPVEVHAVPERTRRALLEWLREWAIDRALRAGDDVGVPAHRSGGSAPRIRPPAGEPDGGPALNAAAFEEEPAPAVGQIRCISPEWTAAYARPLYVACLAEAAPDRLLVAPYGHLSTPGLPGELATGRTSTPLRVLCLWNACPAPAAVLRRSWLVDALSERERSEALAVYDALRGGTPPPDDLTDRLGPPLSHPDDPRHAYVRESERLMADLAEGRTGQSALLEYPERREYGAEELPRAVEPREPYGGDTGEDADGHREV